MFKKCISLLLSMVLLLASLPVAAYAADDYMLEISGRRLTSDEINRITIGNGWIWDPDTYALTLLNYRFGPIYHYSSEKLTIILEDSEGNATNNTITNTEPYESAVNSYGPLEISGCGSLQINSSGSGISTSGDLNVSGSALMQINSSGFGISTSGDLNVSGPALMQINSSRSGISTSGDLNVSGPALMQINSSRTGISMNGDMNISGATLLQIDAPDGEAVSASGAVSIRADKLKIRGSEGLFIPGGILTMDIAEELDITTLNSRSSFAAVANSIELEGCSDAHISSPVVGFYALDGDVVIGGSTTLTIEAGHIGILADEGNVIIKDTSTIDVTGGDDGVHLYALYDGSTYIGKTVQIYTTGSPLRFRGIEECAVYGEVEVLSDACYAVSGSVDEESLVYTAREHSYEQKVATDVYLVSAADCENAAVYYLSCECGKAGTETFTTGSALGHHYEQKVAEYAYLVSAADCENAAVYYLSCECGKAGTETFTTGSALGHHYEQKVAEDAYLVSAADCENPAVYYLSCECGKAGTETFTTGSALGHHYEQMVAGDAYLVSEADCENAAVYYLSCECGEAGTETFTTGSALGHVWGEQGTALNADTHQLVCTVDPSHTLIEEHVFEGSTCTVCGYVQQGGENVPDDPGDEDWDEPEEPAGPADEPDEPSEQEEEPEEPAEEPDGSEELPVTPQLPEEKVPDILEPFEDLDKDAWYADAVRYCLQQGLMEGYFEDQFGPNDVTSRAQLVTILYRLEGEPAFMNDNLFEDVPAGSWYEKAVIWAQGKGIIEGYGNGSFGPADPIKREQAAVILYNYAKYKGLDVSVDENTNFLSFNDFFEVSEYAKPAMMWALQSGLLEGNGWDLNPGSPANRAQTAQILQRFCEEILK